MKGEEEDAVKEECAIVEDDKVLVEVLVLFDCDWLVLFLMYWVLYLY